MQAAAPHTQGLCHFCHAFSLHCSCEHLHDPAHILLPAHPRKAASSVPAARNTTLSFKWGQTSRFLAANQADTWAEHFRQECIDVHMIAAMSVPDLKSVLQPVPAGVLYRLHDAAPQWLEEDSSRAPMEDQGNEAEPMQDEASLPVAASASSAAHAPQPEVLPADVLPADAPEARRRDAKRVNSLLRLGDHGLLNKPLSELDKRLT
ncbi:unnamed protein product [Cladocopium goreaui]|uniref:Uncharacterized protein n=1 Tax=Cladocopium goreaui TaxID=2562237 RepID=A0A9P1DU69_9DINO|nr:unnamed protein product [Cladocopium goreaui]